MKKIYIELTGKDVQTDRGLIFNDLFLQLRVAIDPREIYAGRNAMVVNGLVWPSASIAAERKTPLSISSLELDFALPFSSKDVVYIKKDVYDVYKSVFLEYNPGFKPENVIVREDEN